MASYFKLESCDQYSLEVKALGEIPKDTSRVILQYLRNYRSRWDGNTGCLRTDTVRMVGWKRPAQGWCKLNTDERAVSMGEAGCGGVIRGDCGEWLRGFSMKLKGCSAITAEARGVYEGLKLCWSMGFKKVEVECDALRIVECINNQTDEAEIRWLIQKIRELVSRDWQVQVKHVYREANRCTDQLARLKLNTQQESVMWCTPPREVELLIKQDLEGVVTPRTITC